MEEIEVGALLGYITDYSWGYIVLAFMSWASGVIVHYIKKCKRDDISFIEYWTSHIDASISSIALGLVAFITTLTNEPNASILTYFGIGYAIDSMINKAKGKNH